MEKLLLIAPVFFGYYKEIIKECNNLGIDARFICDAPSNSNLSKAAGRINKKLIRRSTEKYFRNDVMPVVKSGKYDYVFVIAGMTFAFTGEMLDEIRNNQKDAVFILYQWDSEENLPFVTSIHHCFDRIYTFDRSDSERKGIYNYMPLFYTEQYRRAGDTCTDGKTESQAGKTGAKEGAQDGRASKKYDCSYIGTAHPKKYKEINEMSAALKEVFPNQFIFHYMPSYLKYIYHKLKAPEYKGVRYSEFMTKRLSGEEVSSVIRSSFCVLDAPQAGQKGDTIRMIECLGAGVKVITTNPEVKKDDFYRPENIYVYDGNIDTSDPFFSEPYQELPKEIYEKYYLRNWLEKLIRG